MHMFWLHAGDIRCRLTLRLIVWDAPSLRNHMLDEILSNLISAEKRWRVRLLGDCCTKELCCLKGCSLCFSVYFFPSSPLVWLFLFLVFFTWGVSNVNHMTRCDTKTNFCTTPYVRCRLMSVCVCLHILEEFIYINNIYLLCHSGNRMALRQQITIFVLNIWVYWWTWTIKKFEYFTSQPW